MRKKRILLSTVTLVASGFFLAACHTDENPVITNTQTRFSVVMDGADEKPTATTSVASGTFLGLLDESSRVLSYTVTYQGFPKSTTLTMGHLHRITPNATNGIGNPEIPFPTLTSPITGTATLTQARADSLKNGFYYANIHTNVYPGGGIRGDIKLR